MRWLIGMVIVALAIAGALAYFGSKDNGEDVVTIEHTDYHPPAPKADDLLVDDHPDPAKPLKFDPERVHPQPVDDWQVNLSAAYTKLDCPMLKPDADAKLLILRPTYAAALAAVKDSYTPILPSVNLIDGKAKQFDDGLYAALDLAYYRGLKDRLASHVAVIKKLHTAVGPKGQASAFLAAGLGLAGAEVPCEDSAIKEQFFQRFERDPSMSKPIGFYTWNKDLETVFRFLRFFQQEMGPGQFGMIQSLAQAIEKDGQLKSDFEKMISFYSKLSNRPACLSLVDAVGAKDFESLAPLAAKYHRDRPTVAILPSSSSKETVLFNLLFPEGLPPSADLMRELISAIRSGKVNLEPTASSGWYEHQAYALETLLLQTKAPESERLLLTAAYKKRMLEAFKALITKRRETHVRQLSDAKTATMIPPKGMSPRLRLEPAPTYYLRTARAYSFLSNFLESSVGAEGLKSLKGLKQDGERSMDLHGELNWMRDFFYGCYLLSAEDIGLAISLKDGEVGDPAKCKSTAEAWLKEPANDPDLAVDTRVIVPVYTDHDSNRSQVWATVGVRLAKLEARFLPEFPPHIRPKAGGEWSNVQPDSMEPATYYIAVDEFVSATLPSTSPLSREDFRKLCDSAKSKEEVIQKLQQ